MIRYIGVGDFVLDIYYDANKELLGYYPGSSVWNDLMNIKSMRGEVDCGCIATSGCDWASDYIVTVLNQRNIVVRELKKTKKPTKRFSVIVDGINTRSQFECPKCGTSMWYSNVKFSKINYYDYLLEDNDIGIIIIDNVKKDTLKIAKEFKNIGWKVALDLGYISHLRYANSDKINELFSFPIDYFQTNPTVLKFLKSKMNILTDESFFLRIGCTYLNITDGSRGSKLLAFDSDGIHTFICPTIETPVVDTTGAGDAFFSTLLSQIGTTGLFEKDISTVQHIAVNSSVERIGKIGAMGKIESLKIPDSECLYCGAPLQNKHIVVRKDNVTIRNVEKLLERTSNAIGTNVENRLQGILTSVKGIVFTVGTGGSYAAATYAAKVINDSDFPVYACAKHPRDVLIEGTMHVSLVLLFSYSGKTWDIRQVYNHCKQNGISVFVITNMNMASNNGYYSTEDILSYNESLKSKNERGFISMAGTIIPATIFTQAFLDTKEAINDLIINCYNNWNSYFSELLINWSGYYSNPIINIFSGYDTASAGIDLESKIIESGIGIAIVHEKKDFSHGRFNTLEYHSPFAIIILNNETGSYSDKLYNYLSKRNGPRIIVMSTKRGKVLGDFDLLSGCQILAKYLCTQLKVDLAKPNYPEEAMQIYKYSRKDLL